MLTNPRDFQIDLKIHGFWHHALLVILITGLPVTVLGHCFFKCITLALGRSLVSYSLGDSKYALFISIIIHPLTHTSSQKYLNWFNHILSFPSTIFPVPIFPVGFYSNIFLPFSSSPGIKHNHHLSGMGHLLGKLKGALVTQLKEW